MYVMEDYSMDDRLKPYEEKMQKSYDFLMNDLGTIRAGRANPHVLDKIKVDYYGTPTPIQQVGNITDSADCTLGEELDQGD